MAANWDPFSIDSGWIMSWKNLLHRGSGGLSPSITPFNYSRPALGVGTYGPTTNTIHHIHLLLLADDIFVVTHHWTHMLQYLKLLKKTLVDASFSLAEGKTQIVSSDGGFTLPQSIDWSEQCIGDADEILPVL
eukprot:3720216-Amphidinium_carterae.1